MINALHKVCGLEPYDGMRAFLLKLKIPLLCTLTSVPTPCTFIALIYTFYFLQMHCNQVPDENDAPKVAYGTPVEFYQCTLLRDDGPYQ